MGGAIMCPICGDIVGGWNNEPLTACSCGDIPACIIVGDATDDDSDDEEDSE